MKSVRCFIAIEFSAEIKQQLSELKESLAESVPDGAVRWVKPANIHLTLKFLGDTDVAKVDLVGEQLEETATVHLPLVIQLGRLGCFPNPRKPRVVWVGVDGGSTLQDIQGAVEDSLVPLGWPAESRKYHPHLTLGRVKNQQQVVTARYPWGEQRVTGRQQVDELCLIESDLRPSGPVYTVRRRAKLGGELPDNL